MKHLPNDHVDNPIQQKNKLSNDYFRRDKVQQMLKAFDFYDLLILWTHFDLYDLGGDKLVIDICL